MKERCIEIEYLQTKRNEFNIHKKIKVVPRNESQVDKYYLINTNGKTLYETQKIL